MEKINKKKKIWKNILWISGMLIVLLFAISWYRVILINKDTVSVDCNERDSKVFIVNTNPTDTWETEIKTSEAADKLEVFEGATFSNEIINNKDYEIKNWKLKLNIVQECYLNAFWCGSFEIHQFRNGIEKINYIENQAADISKLDVDQNTFTKNMMIHLVPGDYLVYTPSVSVKEDVVKAKDKIGIGCIFYYKDAMDMSNWSLTYENNLKIQNTPLFKITLGVMAIWTVLLIIYVALRIIATKIKIDMDSRIHNVSIMADLYFEVYMLNLETDTGTLIKGNENSLIFNLIGKNIKEKIRERLINKCQEAYRNELADFLNLDTLNERMKDTSNIMMEYCDEKIGWCSVRLFSASDLKNKSQFVIAIQDINEEKRKLKKIEDRIVLAEYKQSVSGSFLETVSFALNDITAKIIECSKKSFEDIDKDEQKAITERVILYTTHLKLIQRTMFDLYELEADKFKLNEQVYNIYDLVEELNNILKPEYEGKKYDFKLEIAEHLPTKLVGDSERIKQILVIILFSSMMMTKEGFIKFSIFGKEYENYEELIFSVRDSASGFTEDQLQEIKDFINGVSINTFDNASLVYLKTINGILQNMNSELKIVSVLNEGSDFYFTIKQKKEQ